MCRKAANVTRSTGLSVKGRNNKMPRFLHCADWQIGRQFASFNPENAHPLADARLTVVERLARLATKHGVDAVRVAGDVFDVHADQIAATPAHRR
jgi:hypothetical protein